ncbi:MAG: DUF368 domain-containing protein [Bacilli bacterium]
MKKLLLIVKGFIMGIANVIPGVSGGTLAIILGIYEQFISSISHFFSNFKENIRFLIPLFIGLGLAIITMSGVIDYSFTHFPIPTTMFFVGLVIGGIPLLYNKVKGKKTNKVTSLLIALFTFSLVIFVALADKIFGHSLAVNLTSLNLTGYITLFVVGVVAAATMVVPGISGSLVLMLLGYYYPILALIKSIIHFENLTTNLLVATVFGLGVILGIVLVSKLIEYLFKKYEVKTYYGVLGFIFASIIAIPISTFSTITISADILNIVIGCFVLGIGMVISYQLGKK